VSWRITYAIGRRVLWQIRRDPRTIALLLGVPVALLAHYASGGDFPWLAEQTYLSPFPAGLRLRHAVSPPA